MNTKQIKRGEIYFADLSPVVGSEQGGHRPVVVIQNNMGNRYSPTTIVAVVTTRKNKSKLPTHHWLDETCGLPKDSMVELEQIRTIDKSRLQDRVGTVSILDLREIDKKIKVSLGLG